MLGNVTSAPSIKVLLVEDNPGDARLTRELLTSAKDEQFACTHVAQLSHALQHLSSGSQIDIILQDLFLPDSQGLDGVAQIRSTAPWTPIVVLTSINDEGIGLQAVQYGAQDFLVKGQSDSTLLTRAIRYAIERKRQEAYLTYLAQYDALTGLANRTLFYDRLAQSLARARRGEQSTALLFIDLDRFKEINDTFGHNQGDLVLKAVADRLRSCVREIDTVARLAGDEFTIILEGSIPPCNIAIVAQRILTTLALPYLFEAGETTTSASIGIAFHPFDGEDSETLIKHADRAMYRAKARGGNAFEFFPSEKG